MQTIDPTALAKRASISQLCEAWEQSATEVKTAFQLLQAAQNRLTLFFEGVSSCSFRLTQHRHELDIEHPEETLEYIQRQVWRAIVERLELRTILSLKRIAELDKQIENGQDDEGNKLPEITFANVWGMLESNLNNAGQYLEEKVLETYEWLRPQGYALAEYKTNQKSSLAGVGAKVILSYAVRHGYGRNGGFDVEYHTRDKLRALDQVFHLLAAKPWPADNYQGPLCNAICLQTQQGKNQFETEFFAGRCFRNQNLHLEFRRFDLVQEFNLIAGGKRLTKGND